MLLVMVDWLEDIQYIVHSCHLARGFGVIVYLKKNLNAPKHSGHPPNQEGGTLSKRLGRNIGCRDKTNPHAVQTDSPVSVAQIAVPTEN